MSGEIEAAANGIFDFLVSKGNTNIRQDTRSIVDNVDKITDNEISQWRENILPAIMLKAKNGRVKTFLNEVSVDKFHLKRVIGCALRRFKRDEKRIR